MRTRRSMADVGRRSGSHPRSNRSRRCTVPIRADRWSCGRVLLHTLDELRKEKDRRLKAIAGKLEAHNPEQRPSLLEFDHRSDLPVQSNENGSAA